MIYGTYIPNRKFDLIRISVLRDTKEIKHIEGVSKSLVGKCWKMFERIFKSLACIRSVPYGKKLFKTIRRITI